MQTTTLPIQFNSTGAPQRNAVNGGGSDGGQFGAMLSNEMEQRNAPPPAPAPAPAAPAPAPAKPQASKPQAADKPVQPDDGAAAASQSTAAAKDAKAADDADKADADAQDDDAADAAAAADPASALLALMASLQKPAADDAAVTGKAATDAASQAYDALGGARGKRSDTAQLAALQAALKSTGKDTGADGVKPFAAAGAPKNPALAAAGADLGAGAQGAASSAAAAGGDGAVDLRALQGAVKADARAQPDMEVSLQQVRDAALLAAQKEAGPAAAALAPAPPASLAAVQAAATAGEQLTARVGTTAWESQVGQKVVYMVGSEEQTASLTLNPPDLGPMQVVLSVTNDQASVTFSSNELEVRQALENALPRLREMMSENGIALGNATVNAGMPDGRQAQDGSARNNDGFGRGNRRGGGRDDGVVTGETTVRPARTAVRGAPGAVDTFA
jgi:flagellar hook-length control protein FliK